MKKIIYLLPLSFLFLFAVLAYGAIPPLDVTVSDASGKVAFRGATNTSGTFATGNLKPGAYVVQFKSKSAAVKGNQYAIFISAGKKKVSADGVVGDKFAAGGIAMKMDVGAGLNITGQVASEPKGAVRDGKKMVWIRPQLGSHMPGRWVEEGSAEAISARNAGRMSNEDFQAMQNKSGAGVPIPRGF